MIRGFPPIERSDARILILGSMPSVASLSEAQYYAHPRNAFWPIMARLLDGPVSTYDEKHRLLTEHRIALWDVVAACEREGSLDSAITSSVANALEPFFQSHPEIRLVCFNGRTAQALYRRHVGVFPIGTDFRCLPSTSPANTMAFERKYEAYASALGSVVF
ncbi:MAG: DNA-deoxyinosine glycosylase [Sphaerochaetaceae bacterium]|jgi:hypoxanthine-DNA glycosylase